jgi:PPOX class probable F420-dependent enzyme
MKPAQYDALWEMVCASTEGVLATISVDGMPHLTNMNYLAAADEGFIRMTTTADRVKGVNMLRDPRAVLHIQGDDWFNFAVVEGKVTSAVALVPGDAATDELHELISNLRGPAERPAFDEEMIRNQRMFVRLTADRLYGQVVRPRIAAGSD